MRLLPKEHEEITKVLDQQYRTDQYLLVKRRGWVYIEIKENTFAFHRKKSAQLNQDNFEDKFQYFVRANKSTKPVENFAEVVEALSEWLTILTR